MAIHTDTVLVVALVGSLGYYLFFYQDDPKVQAEKAAKIQTSVAKQRLQRVSSIERALRTFQARAEKIGPNFGQNFGRKLYRKLWPKNLVDDLGENLGKILAEN